jgi:hypothetical protein
VLALPSAFTSVASVLLEADAPAVNSLLRRAWGSPSTLGGTEVAPTYEVKSAQTVLPLDPGSRCACAPARRRTPRKPNPNAGYCHDRTEGGEPSPSPNGYKREHEVDIGSLSPPYKSLPQTAGSAGRYLGWWRVRMWRIRLCSDAGMTRLPRM